MNISLLIKIVIGAVGYCVWAAMAFYDPSLRGTFLNFNIMMATGTIGLVLRDMQPAAPQTPKE